MQLQGRTFSSGNYRYGFNGKENDLDISEGAIAFEARIYDSRIGKWFSTDPREAEYSWQTPYAYFGNSPISQLDFNGEGGDEKQKVTAYENPDVKIHENHLVKLQKQLQNRKNEYITYYKKIGKLKKESTEADLPSVISDDEKAEIDRITSTITKVTGSLNQAKAEQAQWNKLDREIEDVVFEFNKQQKLTGGDRLDPNLVKAVMFSESEMGLGATYQQKVKVALVPENVKFIRKDLYQLNIGRVTNKEVYDKVVAQFKIPIDPYTNFKAMGNRNDVMLSAGELMYQLDYIKNIGNSKHFKTGQTWFNAVVAYKGVSAGGRKHAEQVWKLYTTGMHPYDEGKRLFKK